MKDKAKKNGKRLTLNKETLRRLDSMTDLKQVVGGVVPTQLCTNKCTQTVFTNCHTNCGLACTGGCVSTGLIC